MTTVGHEITAPELSDYRGTMKLLNHLTTYWQERGRAFDARPIQLMTSRNGPRGALWTLKSNAVNGLPPRTACG